MPTSKISFKSIVWISLPLAAGAVYLAVWFFPELQKTNSFKDQIRLLEKNLAQAYRQSPELLEAQKKLSQEEGSFNQAKDRLSSVDLLVPSEEELDVFLEGKWLGEGAKELSKPVLTEVSRTDHFPYSTRILKLSIAGPYPRLVDYLEVLEKSSPYFHLNSIRVTRKDSASRLAENLEIEFTATCRAGKALSKPALAYSAPKSKTAAIKSPFTLSQEAGRKLTTPEGEILIDRVVFRGRSGYVLISGQAIKEGDLVLGGLLVKEISPQRIVFSKNGSDTILAL